MTLPVTSLLACGLARLLLWLSWLVIAQRRVAGSSIGDGGDPVLQRRIRAQGNLVEYAPMFVILVGLAELQGNGPIVLGGIAGMFLVGRMAHGYALAMTPGAPLARGGGMGLTVLAMLAAIAVNLLGFVN